MPFVSNFPCWRLLCMMLTALVTPRWMSCKVVAGKPIRSLLHRTSLGAEWHIGVDGPPGQQDQRAPYPEPSEYDRSLRWLYEALGSQAWSEANTLKGTDDKSTQRRLVNSQLPMRLSGITTELQQTQKFSLMKGCQVRTLVHISPCMRCGIFDKEWNLFKPQFPHL